MSSAFHHYLGIDYSGAKSPIASVRGVRVYQAERGAEPEPQEVAPPPGPGKHWTRRGLAQWLARELRDGPPALVGIDHGFSFPLAYFEKYGLAHDWPAFLDDFQRHWPTDDDACWVRHVRDGVRGNGAARCGDRAWRRLTEQRAGSAKSVFWFDVNGEVACSTHAGLPWLRFLRRELGARIHFWPFDGWQVPAGRSVIAEAYPRLWIRDFPEADRNLDQHAAYSVAAALRGADSQGTLARLFAPELTPAERRVADIEGWILGVR
ncbi:MAG TPA: hypothetical protein VFT98_20075 [Myxococcota bacterium]|nr:hypothetical protein [Myxococcota bacterium]